MIKYLENCMGNGNWVADKPTHLVHLNGKRFGTILKPNSQFSYSIKTD